MTDNNFENGYPKNKGDFSPLHHSSASPVTQLISPLASNMYSPYFMHEGDTAILLQLDFQFITSHRNGRVILWQMTKTEKEVENKKDAAEENERQQDDDDDNTEQNNQTTKKNVTMNPPASEAASFQAHQSYISDIRLNPFRNLLLTSSWDKTLKLWNVSRASRSFFENHDKTDDTEQQSTPNLNSNCCKWRDVPLGECLSTAVGHTKDVTSCFLFERGIPPLTSTATEEKEKEEQEQEQEKESATTPTSSAPTASSSEAEQDKAELKFKERLIFGLSASRDGTVRLWYFGRMMKNEDESGSCNLQMLQSAVCLKVVYCTCDWLTTIHPIWSYRSSKDIIFLSGGFDGVVSKWRVDLKEILETLSTHSLATNDSNNYKRALQQEQEAVEKLKAKSKMEDDGHDSSNLQQQQQQQRQHLMTSYVASNNKSAINGILVSPDSSLFSVCSKDGSMVILTMDLSRPKVDFEIHTTTFYDMQSATTSSSSSSNTKTPDAAESFLEPVLQLDYPSLYYWLVALSATKITFFDLQTKHCIEVIDCFRDEEANNDNNDEDDSHKDRRRINKKQQMSRKSFTCFSYSFDSRYIYCGLSDGSVRIYEMMKAEA